MNKQEVIDKIKEMKIGGMFSDEVKKQALNIVSQIDEPEKPVLPKFIVEWLEVCKENLAVGLFSAMNPNFLSPINRPIEVIHWLKSPRNQEKFAKAWFNGYEIEKEKLYEVIIPHTSNCKNQKQYLVKQGKNWFFCGNDVNRFKYQFTKGQIEAAGFGWVFEKEFAKEVVEGLNDIC